jgi:membrane associated rhomboid family serine protease
VTTEETSPDVCYRHPKRESWVLCQRCGRTICPECQILAPVGVHCPECVRELGGSVTWRGAGEARRPAAKARAARSTRSSSGQPAWMRSIGQLLRPGSEAPMLSWGTIGVVVVLWLAGLFTGGLPYLLLAAAPGVSLQIWRFFTAAVVYPPDFLYLISILLNGVFFLLTAPVVEKNLGRGRFLVLMLSAAAVGSAAMVLSGIPAFGLIGVLFGMFGSYLIFVWSYPPARAQALIIIGINLLISIAFGAFSLPQIIGGLIAGAGATYLFQRADDHARWKPRTAYLILAAVVAGFILLAILRTAL